MSKLCLAAVCSTLLVITLADHSLGQKVDSAFPGIDLAVEDFLQQDRLNELTAKIEADPTNAAILLERADVYLNLGRPDEMVADLDRAITIEPNSLETSLSAGQIMLQVDPLAAVQYFSHAIKLSNDDSMALGYRAIAYSMAGQPGRGITDLDAALLLSPDNPTLLGLKGNLLMQMERLNEAVEYFSKSISIRPTAQVLFDRAFCNQKAGKIKESIADYTSAYRLDDTLIDAICERGQVYQKSGEFDLAVRDFEHCRKIRPDDPQAALQLAWILATCPDEAVRDGEQALMIVGDHCDPVTCQQTEPLNALAAAYAELGDFEKARILQRRAVALSHFSPDFHEISTRRLNTITNGSPIREADIPLVVLNRFSNQPPREITLDEAMSVPPDILGLSYLEVHTLLEMCVLAKSGARIVASLDGIPLNFDDSNAGPVEELLKKRQAVYEQAIQKRGSIQLDPVYVPQLEGACSEWGISKDPVITEQEGFRIHLSQRNIRHTGVVVESTVVFRHDANTSISIAGEIADGNLVFVTPQRHGVTGMADERCTATLIPQKVSGSVWAKAFFGRALAHESYHDYLAMLADLERAIELDPNSLYWSYLAYTLATCPDETVRNGKRAVKAALTAKKLSDDATDLGVLVALAAAHAEAGDFDSAINYQKQVIENVDGFAKSFHEERLRLFESKKPFHEEPGL